MNHIIEVNGIKLYAYHGCLEEEGKIGGNYIVDVHMKTNFQEASMSDELSQTIDYVHINLIVTQEMAIRSKLIEHVGQRIVSRIEKEIKGLIGLRVKVTKICPPINGDVDNVAISIETGSF
ncbi:dihydroneopterin aldolase [Fluviicola taffensis]|uniref:7,8-dihydroneopterin aldolase n=1 Tax=Fluviicola taffensis (strain DSM 16823 / NCIMB 13979 / RW262) TaxID=755732 RepID=F2IF59_FLUTR|nr:dihydroneopterin aldolase [Fluviicola taffensis]AEA43533.1 dihydroneopterin aldolase [Fluviicola taffensis DSM 16823]